MGEGDPDKDGNYPCPQAWFANFATLKAAAKELNCPVYEVENLPLKWMLIALEFAAVNEEARPALERIAKIRARQQAREDRMNKL